MRIYLTALALLWAVFLSSCTLDRVQGSSDEVITEEMLQQAAQILGSTVSEGEGGVLLSVSDALALISSKGYSSGSSNQATYTKKRAEVVRDYSFVTDLQMGYDKETGFYTVTFRRYGEGDRSQETDTLRYIFRDLEGNEIIYPREMRNQIDNIRFSGIKHGQVYGKLEQSTYTRKNEFFISEILSDTTAETTDPTTQNYSKTQTLPIEGTHRGVGSILTREPNQEIPDSTFYSVSYDFLNVTMLAIKGGKGEVRDFSLSGTAQFSYAVWEQGAEEPSSPQITGTITFNEDGTAYYKMEQSDKRILINLQDGNVLSTDSL